MPYIPEERRFALAGGVEPCSPGELNYAVTCLVWRFIQRFGLGYATINAVVGVLECAKLELYRRVAAPYEDDKIVQNGDVYYKEKP